MRFSTVAATAAFVAGTNAWSNHTGPAYVTEVVTAYTTYCPGPTKITHGHKTYTVTKATTLTISDCPCTVTKPAPSSTPVYTAPVVVKPSPSAPVVVKPSPSAPAPYVPSAAPPAPPAPYKNETTPVVPAPPAGTGSPATSAPPTKFTGAANKAFAASGAGLAAVFGVAAYIL
jgi:hypothetical protein